MSTIGGTLLAPMILARTSNNAQILGLIESVGAGGGIAGSLIISTWGGPKKRVIGVIAGWFLSGFLGQFMFGLNLGLVIWISSAFFFSFFGPIINSSNQGIWQSKVQPDLQGRVFSVRRMIAQITAPLAMLIAGPLADKVFEPAMSNPDSRLAAIFGGIAGTGPGAGMAVIMILTGLSIMLIATIAYFIPRIRHVETLLPDHDLAIESQLRWNLNYYSIDSYKKNCIVKI